METESKLITIMRDFELKYNDKIECLKIEQTKIGEVVIRIEEKIDAVSKTIDDVTRNREIEANRVREELNKREELLREELRQREEKFQRMFAPRLAWDIMRFIGGVAGAAIIIALLTLILKK
jgi:hypothetical protein